MPRMPMTQEIARAVAWDAGNASMRTAGRRAWSEEDYNIACTMFERFWPLEGSALSLPSGG
jgi:hypothetical protein